MKTASQAAQVHYTLAVLDRGRVVRTLPRKRNLILDQGLDAVAVRTWASCFRYAVLGTGTTPTRRDSGAITFARAGNVVTASAGFFVADDVGRLLKFDSGEEVRIVGFSDATTVTTADSGAIAAAEGTIWYVNQTGLTTETKRTGTFANDAGANGTTFSDGVLTLKRTFLFSAESSTVTYREIGWSHTDTAGANLFGRDLLAGSGVTLVSGQQLRVTVELSIALSPAAPVSYSNVVAGWSSDGQQCWECAYISSVLPNGTEAGWSLEMEPSQEKGFGLITDTTALAPMVHADKRVGVISSVTVPAPAYAPGSFERIWTATFGVTQGNSTAIRGFAVGPNYGSQVGRGLRVLLDSPEAKTSSQKLTLSFRMSWGRVLDNA